MTANVMTLLRATSLRHMWQSREGRGVLAAVANSNSLVATAMASPQRSASLLTRVTDNERRWFTSSARLASSKETTASGTGASDSSQTEKQQQQQTPSPAEQKLIDILRRKFVKAKLIEVNDISGGCGSMYTVYVETSEFEKMRRVQQHQLVTDALKAEITNNMHGLRIFTAVPTK